MQNVPKAMRAAVLNKVGEPLDLISDYKVPEINDNQILVKIELSGVDHTDVHLAHGDWATKATIPIITGHEGIGTVVKLGQIAQQIGRFRIGERVGVPWTNGICGQCDLCFSGRYDLRTSARFPLSQNRCCLSSETTCARTCSRRVSGRTGRMPSTPPLMRAA